MAITYSTNLKLTLIGTGDQAGTWGNTTNTNLGTLIEQAIAGYVSQTVADSAGSPTSLSIADGTSSAARNMVLVLQGALSAARDIILPTSTKLYFIHNNTSGGFAVTAKCSGQTGVSIPNGAKVILACNGTDIVEAFNYSGSLIFPTSATITTLSGTTLGYGSASITNASIASGTVTNLLATTFSGGSASITTVTGTTFGTTGASQIRGASGAIGQLTVTSATITNLNVTSLTTGNFPLPTSATIATLSGTTLSYASASLTNVSIGSGTVSGNFNAATASGNVGIGTTSPSFALDVSQSAPRIRQTATTGTNSSLIQLVNSGGTAYVGLDSSVGGLTSAYSLNMYHSGAYPITFSTSGTERMRIDSAGNVGIGTTSPSSKLEASGADCVVKSSATSGYAGFYAIGSGTNNSYLFLGNTTSGEQGRITSENGGVLVFSNGSGATERMRITSAGNVGIGTSTPSARVDARVANIADGTDGGIVNIYSTTAQAADVGGKLALGGLYDGSNYLSFAAVSGRKENSTSGDWSGYMQFSTRRFGGGFAERMRIDSTGNVGIGTTSPTTKLQIGDLSVADATYQGRIKLEDASSSLQTVGGLEYATSSFGAGYGWKINSIDSSGVHLAFGTRQNSADWTETMRITSAGNVGIGATSPDGKLMVVTTGAYNGSVASRTAIQLDNTNTTGGFTNSRIQWTWGGVGVGVKGYIEGGTYGADYLGFGFNTTERMRITSAGDVGIGVASPTVKLDVAGSILASGNVTAYSDIRVKDNVESIEGAIEKLSQIRGVTYTRTDLEDKERKYAGVIAQEIEQVLPEAVFDNGKVKAVDYNATIALLIEAVKEQQKRIDKLETLLNKGN